ncbi:hypothetical protein GCM10011491_31200 [Brucella endophytica]|uniref:Uncharacterized protein n=1 Tax=Brucella endophytica TaxID=1963359 RepID=A0A916WIC3_9HYPH|nr:hypothetical protein [Brucella endophytica]GGB00771.1 hypothetical protein GCM10011491_31200 [Brucella endophytica]
MIIVHNSEGRIQWISLNTDVDAYTANLRQQGYQCIVHDVDADPMRISQNYYVVAGCLTARPAITISRTEIQADGKENAIISGIPDGATVTIDGEGYEVSGGALEFTADNTGTYRISIDAWPTLPFSMEVTAR